MLLGQARPTAEPRVAHWWAAGLAPATRSDAHAVDEEEEEEASLLSVALPPRALRSAAPAAHAKIAETPARGARLGAIERGAGIGVRASEGREDDVDGELGVFAVVRVARAELCWSARMFNLLRARGV
jgi:hypothetical protein